MKNLILILSIFMIIGCDQKPSVRQFTEVMIDAPQATTPKKSHAGMDMGAMGDTMSDPHAGMDMGANSSDPHAGMDMASATGMIPPVDTSLKNYFTWELPKGWVEEEGKGIRIATFRAANNPQAIDVSMIPLVGDAGGIEANVRRWIGQINLEVSDKQLHDFVQASVDDIYDFTQLQQKANPTTPSMIAGIVSVDGAMMFVKMTGAIKDVTEHKKPFIALFKSIQTKSMGAATTKAESSEMAEGSSTEAMLIAGASMMNSDAGLDVQDSQLSWDLPTGWTEQGPNGMRLATFHLADNLSDIDVSIVPLGGMAGGLEANLKRWLGQINVPVSDKDLQNFIKTSADNIFDFTQLQQGASLQNKSMIAVMKNVGDMTVFVKMTGTLQSVSKNKKDFITLAKSVRSK